jgi:hypothetical protein
MVLQVAGRVVRGHALKWWYHVVVVAAGVIVADEEERLIPLGRRTERLVHVL